MKNAALAYKVLDYIRTNPEEWDQRTWHCGTTHCFAGLIEFFITGEDKYGIRTMDVAMDALKIIPSEARALFNVHNTLQDLFELTERIFGPRPSEEKQ